MTERFRVEVETAGVGGVALIIERPDLTRWQQEKADAIIAEALAGLTHDERLMLLALVVEDYADDLAYQRVCQKRGLLL